MILAVVLFGSTAVLSSTSMAQCTVDAGDDITTCVSGSINLSGSFDLGPPSPVLEINQNQNTTCMANFNQGDLAQQFTAQSTTSCGAGVTFVDLATGNLTISLWNNLPNAGGTMLATGTVMVNNSSEGDVYWSSVSLVPGNFYYLVFTTSSPEITTCVAGSTNNPYSGGMLYANAGFGAFPSYDYTFRTHSCSTVGVAPALDIDQDENNTCMAEFNQVDLAQQFTAVEATSCGAGLTFVNAATGGLTISLWSNLPNAGGTMLATGTTMVNNSNEGNVTWPPVDLVPGSFYYLVFTSASPVINTCIAGSTSNPYSGGMLYANSGFGAFPTYDFTFRTFSCASTVNITWTGPNITSGGNTLTPTINPPVGQSTYTMTISDSQSGCTASDDLVVSYGFEVSATNNGNLTLTASSSANYQWVTCPSYTPIAGGTFQTIVITENGSYAVIGTGSNGCVDTSACITIANVDIEDFTTNEVLIYPNPSTDLVVIEFNAASAQIEILDTQGKVIQTTHINSGEQISLKNEQSGVYFIRISTENATSVHRIVRQ